MKTRLMWVLLAVVVNIVLASLAYGSPKNAAAASSSGLFYHCCKETAIGDPYCCGYCCLFRFDCFNDSHCGEE